MREPNVMIRIPKDLVPELEWLALVAKGLAGTL